MITKVRRLAAILGTAGLVTILSASAAQAAGANVLPTYMSATPYATTIATGWSASPTAHAGITTYHLQLALVSSGTVQQDTRITATSYHFNGLASGTRYEWRLAVGQDPWHLASPWSSWRWVTTTGAVTPPPPPPPPPGPGQAPAPQAYPGGTCGMVGAPPAGSCIPLTDYASGTPETSLTGAQIDATWDLGQTFEDACPSDIAGPNCPSGPISTDANGNLLLTNNGATNSDTQATSAFLDGSGQSYTYGIFEAEIYLPGSNGHITNWPAFWLSGLGTSWPVGGEFDIMESGPFSGYVQQSDYHWPVAPIQPQGNIGTQPSGQTSLSVPGWHNFTGVWEQDYIAVYIDGVHTFDYFSTNVTGAAPLEVIFDNASAGTGQTSTVDVGWFRAFAWSGN